MRAVKPHCVLLAAFFIIFLTSGISASSPPRITLAPSDHRVFEEGTISFFCRASGNPQPTFQWMRDGRRIRVKSSNRHRFEIHEQPYISGLRIKDIKGNKDNTTFACVATNKLGITRADARLFVYPKATGGIPQGYPEIKNQLSLRSVEKGRSAQLNCDAVGDPKPQVMWLKNSLPVDLSDSRIQLLESGHLQIRNSQESDEGTYECVAENKWGVAYSHRAMMYIKVRRIAPKFDRPPADVKVFPGSDVNLTCVATGSPRPYVKWKQGNTYLTDEDDVPLGRNVLSLTEVRQSTNYTCEASSYLGKIKHNVQVIVQAPGSPPQNLRAKATSTTEVLVYWDAPKIPNGVIKGYKVFYTKHPEQPIFFWDVLPVNSDNRLATISGLTPNATYTITVLAFSAMGQGPMSMPIQVLTTQGVSYQPINLVAKAISPNVIVVSWDPPQEADKILSYQLFYNDSHSRQSGQVSIDPHFTNYRLVDQTPDTVYNIQVSARSESGEGPRTPTVQVHTPAFIPGMPRQVKVEAINSTGLFVEWSPPKADERNGIILGYMIHYIEVDSKDKPLPGVTEQIFDVYDPQKTEAVITGLKPDSYYMVEVCAFTRKGDGFRSRPRVVLTKGAVPSAPTNMSVSMTQKDPPIVKVVWQRPKDSHGDIMNYQIIWGPQGQQSEEVVLQPEMYSYLTHYLDVGTTYEFRVSARNKVDYGDKAFATISTPDGVPAGAPQNFTAKGFTETSVRLDWDPPARKLHNGEIVMYQVTFSKLSDPINEENQNCTGTFVDLVGLEMNTDYMFKIRAYTSKGSGPWSNQLHFRTFGRRPPSPKNVQVRRTSSTRMEVTWNEPEIPVSGYKVFYSTFATPSMYTWQQEEFGPYTVAVISGLEPKMTYAVRVQAKSVDGRYGNLSAVVLGVFTEFHKEDAVKNFRVTQRLTDRVKLSWQPPDEKGVTSYILRYAGKKTYKEDGQTKQIIDKMKEERIVPPQTTFTVTGLQPKMKYYFNISAIYRNKKKMGYTSYIITETLMDGQDDTETPGQEHIESQGKIVDTVDVSVTEIPLVTTNVNNGVSASRQDTMQEILESVRNMTASCLHAQEKDEDLLFLKTMIPDIKRLNHFQKIALRIDMQFLLLKHMRKAQVGSHDKSGPQINGNVKMV